MTEELVLEMRGIRKEFPGVLANDDVDFDVRRGEVHALLGENGAGKSTLMTILCGLYKPDAGEILLHGKPISFASARDAIQAGIGMVHQHFMLIPVMTVAENIVLGMEPSRDAIFLDERAAEARVRELSEQFGLVVDPKALVSTITVGQEQRVEILKALFRGADILILDEPTAVLTPQEAGELFAIVRSLKADGKSIIFISHKLNEVLEIADRITVLRRGKKIETVPREGATEASLAHAMVGREVLLRVEKPPSSPGDILLSVDTLNVIDERGIAKVRDVSFSVRAGEIVGIAGVDGNGQTELIEAITGLRRMESGTIQVAGKTVHARSPREMLDAGVGHIPEDRQRRGLVLEFSIAENVGLHDYDKAPDSKWGWLFPKRMVERAGRLIKEFDVRGGGPQTRAGGLSGGNQQKVVVAREVSRDPKVLIAAQPTRGLDVGAIEFLHRRLVAERDEGRAILLVSLELDEIFSLADRILVMYEGEIVGEHSGEVSEHQIGLEMVGAGEDGGGVTSVDPTPPTEPPAEDAGETQSLAANVAIKQRAGGIIVPVLTALIAFLIGGLVVLATGHNPLLAYRDIFNGAGLNWFFHPTTSVVNTAAYNLSQTLLQTTTLILTGLAVAFAFRCGMFNIGGQGQYFIGLYVANWLGHSFAGMATVPHILIAVVGATLAGAAWAGIAGVMKATVGAHEVITTIMLNWIAIWVGEWLFGDGGPLQNSANKSVPISNDIAGSAQLPVFWGEKQLQGLHVGFFVALGALVVFSLVLNRTTLGFEVRAVGFNPEAAAYAGISVRKNLIRAMAISGAFAGLAGGLDMLGYLYHYGQADIPVSTVGFLGIAVALLGRNTAVGVGISALLFGALLFGTTHGLTSNVIQPELAGNLTYIIQGLVVLFVGADVLILSVWAARKRVRRRAGTAEAAA